MEENCEHSRVVWPTNPTAILDRPARRLGDHQRRPSCRNNGMISCRNNGMISCRNNGMISGTQITPSRRADIPELSQFLISDPATSYLFSHEVLLWKYFDGPSGPSGDSVCSLIALGGQDHRTHWNVSPPVHRIGRRSDASIDNARHRLAGLGCASRLGSLIDAESLCD